MKIDVNTKFNIGNKVVLKSSPTETFIVNHIHVCMDRKHTYIKYAVFSFHHIFDALEEDLELYIPTERAVEAKGIDFNDGK